MEKQNRSKRDKVKVVMHGFILHHFRQWYLILSDNEQDFDV